MESKYHKTAEEVPESSETPPTRRPRAAGRPRSDESASDAATAKRKLQLRRSQQTYRKRKAAASKGHEERAAQLEGTVCQLEQMLANFKVHATQMNVDVQYPGLYAELQSIQTYLAAQNNASTSVKDAGDPRIDDDQERPRFRTSQDAQRVDHNQDWAFATQENASDALPVTEATSNSLVPFTSTPPQSASPFSSFCYLETHILPGLSGPQSFSYQEVSFSRRLQRQCVEFSLNLFVDERTNPGKLYRVFRLVPCVQDKKRTLPTIQKLITLGAGEVLEVAQQPFYRIGGAGGHYPHYDREGKISELPNTRLPKRLLGIPYHVDTSSPSYQEYLNVYGFGEEWYDCEDVAGFLQDMGFRDAAHHGSGLGPMARPQYEFDIDAFLRELVPACTMLGRAPGFRRTAVVAAFNNARRQQQAGWMRAYPS